MRTLNICAKNRSHPELKAEESYQCFVEKYYASAARDSRLARAGRKVTGFSPSAPSRKENDSAWLGRSNRHRPDKNQFSLLRGLHRVEKALIALNEFTSRRGAASKEKTR